MSELLTAAQMRALEQAAIASGRVTGLELMERAGRGVVEAVFDEWPALRAHPHHAVVLCGPGNNGGDGFVVARLLREWGWEVEVFLYGDPEHLPPDARVNYDRWVGMGRVGPAHMFDPWGVTTDILVDAIFGTGINRILTGSSAKFVEKAASAAAIAAIGSVAVDLPSGLCSDSGRLLGPCPEVALSVTFHRPKLGHYLANGIQQCRKIRVMDIGLERTVRALRQDMDKLALLDRQRQNRQIVRLTYETYQLYKSADEHKYTHGHALVLSGPSGHGGAARLAARGALRIGAGLVTVGCPAEALVENAARLDAVMLRAVVDADALAVVLADKRINALCLGPGMGTTAREVALVAAVLGAGGGSGSSPGRGLVLDADALTILSQTPDLFAALHDDCVLTPHAGEFARLFPDLTAKLAESLTRGPAYSKVDATCEASARAGCVVLYKGADTVIADPSGRCAVNSAHYDRAAPWLATAGSGDVLTGFITGLLARGLGPFDAACTAAWLHVKCAHNFGPGLIAEDLPEELPKVFRALGM